LLCINIRSGGIRGQICKAGEDTDVRNVIYGIITPGIDDKTMKSINDKRGCPP
jgi:hypothetical protein